MERLNAFADRLDQIRQVFEQPGVSPTASLEAVKTLAATVTEMKAAAEVTLADLKSECLARVEELRARAKKLQTEQAVADARARGEGPDSALPHPWEDHQGLPDDKVNQLANDLVRAALPPSAQGSLPRSTHGGLPSLRSGLPDLPT